MARPNNSTAIRGYIKGLSEAKARFQALPEITRDLFNEATETTLSEVRRIARQKLKASPSIRSRALYNAVNYRLNKKSGIGVVGIQTGTTTMQVGGKKVKVKGIVVAGSGGSALKSQGAMLIRPTRYAHLIEFGRAGAPAEPFMRPAVAFQKPHFEKRMRDAGKGVERKMSTTSGLV